MIARILAVVAFLGMVPGLSAEEPRKPARLSDDVTKKADDRVSNLVRLRVVNAELSALSSQYSASYKNLRTWTGSLAQAKAKGEHDEVLKNETGIQAYKQAMKTLEADMAPLEKEKLELEQKEEQFRKPGVKKVGAVIRAFAEEEIVQGEKSAPGKASKGAPKAEAKVRELSKEEIVHLSVRMKIVDSQLSTLKTQYETFYRALTELKCELAAQKKFGQQPDAAQLKQVTSTIEQRLVILDMLEQEMNRAAREKLDIGERATPASPTPKRKK